MGVIGRRRRPRWLWLLVTLTAVVLMVNLVVATRSDAPSRRVAALGYLDEVRAQIEQSNRQGADVTDIRSNAADLGRAGITRRLERATREAEHTLATARTADPPGDLADARNLLLSTLWLRAHATANMKDALESALGKTSPQAAITKMASVGADLTTADRTYQAFLRAVNDKQEVGKAAVLPPSRWIEETEDWEAPSLNAFITALRNAAQLAPIHDTTVVLVTTDPGAVRKEGERLILPLSKIKVQVIVANIGNEPERDLTVEVTLIPGGAKATARDFVSLAPGQRTTMTFSGMDPVPDQVSALKVRIDAPAGDPTLADNERTIEFIAKQ